MYAVCLYFSSSCFPKGFLIDVFKKKLSSVSFANEMLLVYTAEMYFSLDPCIEGVRI